MAFNITEIDGVLPENGRFPVNIYPTTHEISGPEHTGQLADNQIPANIVRWDDHQNDPHTMLIDGRDVSVDGTKLDSIEFGAEVNNLTDQQAFSLTGGTHTNWHNHDEYYYRKAELYTPGLSQVNWVNLINLPPTFTPSPHNHDDRYYTEVEISDLFYNKVHLDNGQLDNRYYTEIEINDLLVLKSNIDHIHDDRYLTEVEISDLFYTKVQLDNGQLDNRYYTEVETGDLFYTKVQLDNGQLDNRYYTEFEIQTNYYTNTQLDNGQLDNRYYTEVEISDLFYNKVQLDNGQLDNRYYTEIEVDQLITASTFGIAGSVDTYDNLPIIDDVGLIYIVRETSGVNEEGFYRWDGNNWLFLANNTGTSTHNQLIGLNIGDYKHLTDFQFTELTSGQNTSIHLHDNRYYTEIEIDDLLNNYYTKIQLDNGQLDNRYYTEIEIDDLLNNYYTKIQLDNGQLDNRYYTEVEIDSLLATKSNITHLHDDRYYTETEINTLLVNKSDVGHTHDDRYFTEIEITTNYYTKNQLNTGQLDNRYYTETEINSLLAGKAALIHNHDDLYYPKTHIDQLSSMYSLTSHTHDDKYYLESEVDALLNAKADVSHNHNSLYFTKTELGSSSGISGASRIGVSLIGGLTATNVQSALQELKSQISSTSVTLNQAYITGSVITTTNTQGPVKIDATGSTRAPLELTNLTTAPTSNLSAGQIAVIDNELYIYNIDKNKWLTPTKTLLFGRSGSVDGHSLYTAGLVGTFNSGYKMVKNGTITSATIEASNSPSKNIYILINGSVAYTITSTPSVDTNINLDFNTGDFIGMYVDSAGSSITNVVATLEIAWRK